MTTFYNSWAQSFASAVVGTNDVLIRGAAIFQVSGTFTGSIRLLRSNADEDNFVPVKGLDGNDVALTVPGVLAIDEPDSAGGRYKAEATALSAATAVVRIKDGGATSE